MSYRKLKIDSGTWEYTIGSEGVKIRSPKGKCDWVEKWKLHGMTASQHSANCYEHYDCCADCWGPDLYPTGPGDIKKYIEETLI